MIYRALFLLLSINCFSGTIYVNINVVGGNNDGTSWGNAYAELQEALVNAQANDEIWVATGTYLPDWNGTAHDLDKTKKFLINKQLSVYGGFVGTEVNRTDRNWWDNKTILSGDLNKDDVITYPNFSNVSDNTEQIIRVPGGVNSVIIDGFSIVGSNGLMSLKSAIALEGSIVINNSTIFNNQGKVIIEEPAGQSRLENCLIFNNYNSSNGTIFTHDVGTHLINCTIVYNKGQHRAGLVNGAYLTGSIIENTIFWGNTAVNNTYTLEEINCHSQSGGNSIASFENNIVEGFTGTQYLMTSSTNLALDPLFTNVASKNFTIQETSPGKDAGNNTSSNLTLDLFGNQRIENSSIDIGVFETVTTLSIDDFVNSESIKVYPNPVENYIQIVGVNNHEKVEIFDVLGKKIVQIETEVERLNISSLKSGVYFIKIYSHKTSQIIKIIKK